MRFEFKIEVELTHTAGVFASRDELEAQLQEALEGADYGMYEGDNGGEYEAVDWSVTAVEQ